MRRRDFLRSAGIGAAAAGLALPARAETPTIKWRLASSFPKSLDTIYGGAETLTRRVSELTEGRFEIRVFAGGELVPPFGVLDAVQQATVECGHTVSYYYFGKNRALALETTIPFGLNARQLNAWTWYGGGMELLRALFAEYNILNFPGGSTGAQMGGWYRKEIRSLKDIEGLKIRIPGFGAEIFSRMGALPQTLPGAEVYPALERGAIDAAEWTVPSDDEKLGFYKVAKYYYYPGWWEPGAQLVFYVNKDQWAALPPAYQAAFQTAAAEAHMMMLAAYDAKNPPAMQRLVQNGAVIKRFPDDVLLKAYETALAVYAEESARNPAFKGIYDSLRTFQETSDAWWGVAESSMTNFLLAMRRKK
ncbi:TRAP transporter substrate-binding protein [Candidatus Thiodictyon syntrophicum]|jgi:TRAP-type mannitol/chloroaromatic compound transport system substrate-binding protein|uniref:ABC transporter substrate-binding protein n=1 Tax=Candidatus Thiodictyon syntrophicum TaxID=1166950 RepID=A0A2K8UIJ4_9GAMM|nr:TRAP transporter substrate-binding protein [Candidatus Thiodictyon syntrophicum]AUB85394.1 ABC transporter substrate-binding protein [Candidatus Thiodictyon syntrophicum]